MHQSRKTVHYMYMYKCKSMHYNSEPYTTSAIPYRYNHWLWMGLHMWCMVYHLVLGMSLLKMIMHYSGNRLTQIKKIYILDFLNEISLFV